MQLIFASFWFSGTSYHLAWQGGPNHSDLGDNSGAEAHGRGSPGHLRAGARSGGVCLAANGQIAGRKASQTGRFSVHAFRDETSLREGNHASAPQEAGPQKGTQMHSSAYAARHSSAGSPS